MTKRTIVVVLAAFLCGALVSGCAYFNTLYNARTAYEAALKVHRKQQPADADTLVLPSGEALTNYNRAFDKAGKVIEVYPKKKKWHDDAFFLMAQVAFERGEYSKTIRILRQFQKEYDQSPFMPESHLLLGKAHMYDGNLNRAEELFELVMEKYSWLNANDEVSLLLARLAVAREGKSLAVELLEQIRNSVHSAERKIDLTLQIARLYIDLSRYDKAVAVLRTAPRREKLVDKMFQIDILLLSSLIELDSLSVAGAFCRQLLSRRSYEYREAELFNKQGIIARREGNIDNAIEIFERVTKRWPTGVVAGEAWFELGELYQLEKSDLVKARECYDQAAKLLPATSQGEIARQRVSALDLLGKLRTQIVSRDSAALTDTLDRPDSTFLEFSIGELFWLELDQPDSAYAYFSALSLDSTLDTIMQAKTLYASAYLSLNALADTGQADSLYRLLIGRFPQDEHSKRAQEERDWPRTVQTERDKALAAFREAEQMLYGDNNPVGAANAFLRVHRTWPAQEIAPRSLLAAAWVCDELLHKNETAKKLYEQLCKEYPQSEYCVQVARPRIRTVMDTLDALQSAAPAAREAAPTRRNVIRSSRQAEPASEPMPARPKEDDLDLEPQLQEQ